MIPASTASLGVDQTLLAQALFAGNTERTQAPTDVVLNDAARLGSSRGVCGLPKYMWAEVNQVMGINAMTVDERHLEKGG